MKVEINIQDRLSPALAAIRSALEGPDRVRVSNAMGVEIRSLIVRHLTNLADSRHTTADRLGATPTGYLANLAENFDQSSTVQLDAEGVTLTMRHPAILRSQRDVTITAKKQFLTIPLNAIAYGRRAGEFDKVRLVKQGEHRGPEGKKSEPYDNSIAAYLLVRSVTQKRDPSLMPDESEIGDAAVFGARSELKAIIRKNNLLG